MDKQNNYKNLSNGKKTVESREKVVGSVEFFKVRDDFTTRLDNLFYRRVGQQFRQEPITSDIVLLRRDVLLTPAPSNHPHTILLRYTRNAVEIFNLGLTRSGQSLTFSRDSESALIKSSISL